MKRLILILIFITALMNFSFAAFSNKSIGTRGAQFLKIGVGARGVAMGESLAAATDDVNSIYWNPAGLNGIKEKQVSFMHASWFESIKYEQVSYAQRISTGRFQGVVGGMISYLTMDEIQKYDNLGMLVDETYSPKDFALTLSYARLYKNIPLGVNLKYISSKIENEKATAVALDFGGQYYLEKQRIMLGAAIQNFGTKLKYMNKGVGLPFNIKLGGAYVRPLYKGELLIVSDINMPVDESMKIGIGAEYTHKFEDKLNLELSPRLGLRTDKSELEGLNSITFGLGINYKEYDLDYALAPYGELGTTHRVSLIFKFDKFFSSFPKKKVEQEVGKTTTTLPTNDINKTSEQNIVETGQWPVSETSLTQEQKKDLKKKHKQELKKQKAQQHKQKKLLKEKRKKEKQALKNKKVEEKALQKKENESKKNEKVNKKSAQQFRRRINY